MRYKFFLFFFLIGTKICLGQSIYGVVVDQNDNPIPFANVYITAITDTLSIIEGGISDLKGEFKISSPDFIKHKEGFLLHAAFVGYRKYHKLVDSSKINNVRIQLESYPFSIQEVEVVANTSKRAVDKDSYIPSSVERKNAITSLSLIGSAVSSIRVDEINNKILSMRGESVKVLINGRNASEIELLSIKPNQVIKIEHYSIPPARFSSSDLAEVVNIITKQDFNGGNVFTNLQNSPFVGYGNNILSLNYSRARTQLGIYYYYSYRDYSEKKYDENLNYVTDTYTIQKNILGNSSLFGYKMHIINLNLVNSKNDNYALSIKINPNITEVSNNPGYNFYKTRNLMIIRGDGSIKSKSFEFTPSLDLYFLKVLPRGQEFLINFVGNFYETESEYQKVEIDDNKDTLVNSNYLNNNKKKSLIAEILYTKKFKTLSLSSGVKIFNGYLNQSIKSISGANRYKLETNDKYVYSELKTSINKISVQASLGVTQKKFREVHLDNYNFISFTPMATIFYNITQSANFKLHYRIIPKSPSLSQLNNLSYNEDEYLIFVGNPNLKPYKTHYFSFNYNLSKKKYSIGTMIQYSYSSSPIFARYTNSGENLVKTYNNEIQRKEIVFSTFLNLKLFQEKLSTTFYIATFNFTNRFSGIKRDFEIFDYYYSFSFEYVYKKFLLNGSLSSPLKNLESQDSYSSPAESDISFNYRHKSLTIGVGVYLPISSSYMSEGKSLSSSLIDNWYRSQIYDNGRMLYLRMNYSFSFGYQYNWQKKVNNQDLDTGTIKHE